mgnify:CR=1 FL=1
MMKEIVKILIQYDAGMLSKDQAKDEIEKLYIGNAISYSKMLLVQTLVETTQPTEEYTKKKELSYK